MKTIYTSIILISALLTFVSCGEQKNTVKKELALPNTSESLEVKDTISLPTDWMNSFDFDGDGKIDSVKYNYSGGAHCCYTLKVWSSKDDSLYIFPYEIEGGYLFFDLSQPEQFDIKDFDKDDLPEIFIGKQKGVRKKNILIDYYNGHFRTLEE